MSNLNPVISNNSLNISMNQRMKMVSQGRLTRVINGTGVKTRLKNIKLQKKIISLYCYNHGYNRLAALRENVNGIQWISIKYLSEVVGAGRLASLPDGHCMGRTPWTP